MIAPQTRRQFLRHSAFAAAGLGALRWQVSLAAAPASALNKLNLGVIGVAGRGGAGEPVLTDLDLDGDGTAEQLPAPQAIRWQSLPFQDPSGTQAQVRVWNRVPVETTYYGEASQDTDGNPTDLRDLTQPYRWPRAIRITLRVVDPAGRLPDPITHTIVHTWQ